MSEDRNALFDPLRDLTAATGVGLAQSAVIPLMTFAINRAGKGISQENSIGELFTDFANKNMLEGEAQAKALPYSSVAEMLGISKEAPAAGLADFLMTLPSRSEFPSTHQFGSDRKDWELNSAEQLMEDLIKEEQGAKPLDKMYKMLGYDFDKPIYDANELTELEKVFGADKVPIQEMNPSQEFQDFARGAFGTDKARFYIHHPRNHLQILAHELGHAEDTKKIEEFMGGLTGDRYGLGSRAVGEAMELATGPTTSLLSKSEGFNNLMAGLAEKSPALETLIRKSLGSSAPALATGLFAASSTARDLARKILPFEPVNKAIDLVEEHPVATAMSGALPQLAMEAYTTMPGAKLTYDFFNHLNTLNPETLKPVEKAMLGDLVSSLGKFHPTLETAKFLGHNALLNSTAIITPLLLAAAAYFNTPSKEKTI